MDNFSEYVFVKLGRMVAEVEKESGRKVLNLGPGSPDFPPSKINLQKLKEFIDEPQAHLYPGYGANKELSEALTNWYHARFGVDLKDDELYPLLGAKDGVSHLSMALLDKDDEFLVPDPGYPGFSGSALMLGAKPLSYNLLEKNYFKIDFDDLSRKITSRTKFIWVNFPSNPTGQVIRLAELEKLVVLAKKKKIWLVYDNAYSEITFGGYIAPSILQVPGAKDVCVEIGSFSKTFSLAGYRMGWMVGNSQVIEALAKVKSQMDSGMAMTLQKLGAYVLNNFDNDWHEKMIESYEKRRDIIAVFLKKLGLKFDLPKAGLYLWAKIPDNYRDADDFSIEMLKEKQVLFTPGTAFGKNGKKYVRISFCSNIENINNYFL